MGREGIEQGTDAPPCCFDGSFCGFSEQVFQFGEDLLDRIEIRAVGWQEQQARASGSDCGPDRGLLVAGQVVEDDDVTWRERGAELLFDPLGEAGAIDRLIEDKGCVDPVTAQGSDEGHRLPVAIGYFCVKPLTFGRPASQRCHVRLGPGLVDEHEAGWIRPPLILLPLLPPPGDLRPQLLGGKNAFF